MAQSKYSSQLQDLQRHITSHDASGKSIYTTPPAQQYMSGPQTISARTYAVERFPVNLEDDNDIKAYTAGPESPASAHNHSKGVALPGGITCNTIEIAPSGESIMHRTLTFDIAICTNGQIACELDSGEKIILNPGDHIIQRATMHKWSNASKTEPTRLVAVCLPCLPFEVGDKKVE